MENAYEIYGYSLERESLRLQCSDNAIANNCDDQLWLSAEQMTQIKTEYKTNQIPKIYYIFSPRINKNMLTNTENGSFSTRFANLGSENSPNWFVMWLTKSYECHKYIRHMQSFWHYLKFVRSSHIKRQIIRKFSFSIDRFIFEDDKVEDQVLLSNREVNFNKYNDWNFGIPSKFNGFPWI